MNKAHELISPPDYLLSYNCYLDLKAIRDRLQLVGRLAGNASTLSDRNAALLMPRVLLGEFFLELSEQLSSVLEAVEYYEEHVSGEVGQ